MSTTTTGPRNVREFQAAIAQMNEIANEMADRHGMCGVWEEIMQEINETTGLNLVGRDKTWSISFEITVVVNGPRPTDEFRELTDRVANVLATLDGVDVDVISLDDWSEA